MLRTLRPARRLKTRLILSIALACVAGCLILSCACLRWLVPAAEAAAPLGFNISGHVADSSGNAVADVTITLTLKQGGVTTDTRTTLTDSGGNYSFSNLPSGQNNAVVEPSKSGLIFTPSSVGFVSTRGLDGDFTANFTAHTTHTVINTNDSGFGSLRQAILDAASDDAIIFAIPSTDAGCTGDVCTISLTSGQLTIDKNLGIRGPGANKLTVARSASAATNFRVFNIISPSVVDIFGLTISNGNDVSGGGINNAGTLAVINCVISGNTGGGIASGGTLNLFGSTVSGNTGNDGGGISSGGTVKIFDSTISGNTASTRGGGLFLAGSSLVIRNSTITANKVNSAVGGGGIFTFSTVTVGNTIIAANKGLASDWDLFGGFSSEGHNLIGESNGGDGFTVGTNNANGDLVGSPSSPILARLGPLADNGGRTPTHALLPGSPAIDAGSNAVADSAGLLTDQRGTGFSRSADGDGNLTAIVDIGAFEVQTLYVNTTADASDTDTADGICDSDAATAGQQCTLRAAIEQANALPGTDAITFALSGPIPKTITLGALGALPNLSSSMMINGPGANVLTVERSRADGTPDFRIFWVSSGQEVSIAGLTIANGKTVGSSTQLSPGKGGAIYNDHSTLWINNCAFTGNSSNIWGGAILNDGENSATGAQLTITNSTLSGNKSSQGGAVFNDGMSGYAALTITNSTFSGNQVDVNAGAIYNDANNSQTTTLTIINSTITNNRATSNSGGLYSRTIFPSKVALRNTIVAGNIAIAPTTPIDIGGQLDAANSSFNLIGDCPNCGLSNGTNNNQVGVTDIRLGPLAYNGGRTQTHALLPGSPAIDKGSNDLIPQDTADLDGDHDTTEPVPFDQRGQTYARKADGADADLVQTVDIGAFEANPSIEDISDKTVLEDRGTSFTFNYGDRSLGAGASMEAVSSNTGVILKPNVIGDPTGSTAILSFITLPDAFGSSTITVTFTNNNGAKMTDTFDVTVLPVNDAPLFAKGPNQSVNEDAGAQTVQNWATGIKAGPANESGQALNFIVTNNNNGLFSAQPSIDSSGTLAYTPAPNQSGTATVSVALHDDGGTANGGQDTSIVQTFTITVAAVNDAPTLDSLSDLTINEDTAQTVNLTGITAGGGESQLLNITTTSSNPGLIANPAVNYSSPNTIGSISLTPAPDQSGSALITVTVTDGGGTANGGVEAITRTFNVTVTAVNDAPVITVPGATQNTVTNSALAFSSINGNAILVSDVDAGGNPLQVTLTPTNGTVTLAGTAGLSFTAGDGISDASMSFTGSLTSINAALSNLVYTPAPGFSGTATLTLTANDQGSTGAGGALASTGTINITVNSGGSLQFGASTYTISEDGGQASITVTRTGGTAGEARVNYTTGDGTALTGSDYSAASGTLTFADGVASQSFTVPVINDSVNEADETVNLTLSNAQGSGTLGAPAAATLTITNDDTPTLQFSQANYSVSEGGGFLNIVVTRGGDTSVPVTVKYATSDTTDASFRCDPATAGQPTAIASRKCDYHIAVGSLRFAPGEVTKRFSLSIVDDVYVESPESFTLTLSAPAHATLGQNYTVPVTIMDDDVPGTPNPIDNTRFYVRQLYVDLLSREPDPNGWNGWTSRIDQCGQPGQPPPPCDRVTVGGDGFLRSGEFFDRQFFVLRLYRTGLGRILRYDDIGDLAYVSGFLTAEELELNKHDLVEEMVSRPEFSNIYAGLDDTQFVDKLLQTADISLAADVRQNLIDSIRTKGRAQVFREISERPEVSNKYLHEAQVVSAYYGFFTRNPDGAYKSYLQRLDSGEINLADLANAFINAQEYRQRFGQ